MSFRLRASDFALDLGTSNILLYKKEAGLVANESSVVVLDENTAEILKFGEDAKDLIGKTPDDVAIVRPIVSGAISDFNITEAMLNYFFQKINPGFSVVQPRVIISTAYSITDIQRRALEDAALHAGAGDVTLMNQSLAASFAMGLNPNEAKGLLLVNLGGGISEVTLISLNGIVAGEFIKKGGDDLDEEIMKAFRKDMGFEIGKNTAEEVKNTLASLLLKDKDKDMEIDGRDSKTGRPIRYQITASQLIPIFISYAGEVIEMIYRVMEKTPPALSADIMKNGIYFTGGLSLLKGLVEYIQSQIEIPCFLSENPLEDTIRGCGMVVENRDLIKRF